jgi:hypothetical protein
MELKSPVIVVIVSCYGVEVFCNRFLLWGWIPQEVRITLKSCIIYISCSDNSTAIHRPPQKYDAVAGCPSNAHGPAGAWNAGRHVSDVLAFQQQQQQRSWRGCCGLAWPGLGAEHFTSRRCALYTKWRQFNWNTFSAYWRSAASRFVSGRKCMTLEQLVTGRSVFCRPTVVVQYGLFRLNQNNGRGRTTVSTPPHSPGTITNTDKAAHTKEQQKLNNKE